MARAKYGKICFDLTHHDFANDGTTYTNIKSEDFDAMMPKQISVLINFESKIVELPLNNFESGDGYYDFILTFGSETYEVMIVNDEEYIYISTQISA